MKQLAILDTLALGRKDYRHFVILRHLLRTLQQESFGLAVHVLAHTTPHPDIFWTKNNWIPAEVSNAVKPHLSWSLEDVNRFFDWIPWEEWTRGGLGQSAYMLLVNDPDALKKCLEVSASALRDGMDEVSLPALYVALYLSGEAAKAVYWDFASVNPRVRSLHMASEVEYLLEQFGHVSMF